VSIETPRLCDFVFVTNSNFRRISATVFEILALKARKWLIFSTSPLFDAPARRNPLEFLDEIYLAKTRHMGLPYGKNFIVLSSTLFVGFTRVTDGLTGDSI